MDNGKAEAAAVWVPTAELKAWQENPRKNDKAVPAVMDSIKRFGFASPIIARPCGEVIAGHTRLKAALELRLDRVPVRYMDLDPADAKLLALADNRAAELADWDDEGLAAILRDLEAEEVDLSGIGWDLDDLAEMMSDEPFTLDGTEDEVPELQAEVYSKQGEVYELGPHRLMCGDSTGPLELLMGDGLAALVFTDPPYGVGYDGGTTKREKLVGDENTDLYGPACLQAAKYSDDKSPLYLWHAGVKGIAAAAAAAAAGYEIRSELIWNKNLAQFGALSAQYKQKHEPCYYCFKRGKPPRWFGPTNEVTVWDCDRSSKNEYHPTQKPVELAIRAIQNSTERGDAVLDLFGGSGSTLIGAAITDRAARLVELDPRYCDVIRRRWTRWAQEHGQDPGAGVLEEGDK